jgi:acyl transferase domain-containing protein/NAD(P)-dependent dehydrogenase (short-subunit alcohol dehydrogenase family)/acyl carrier protein
MSENNKQTSINDQLVERLRQSLGMIEELTQKLDGNRAKSKEPIAVIGMGCRFPNGANGLNQYWSLLSEGKDAITSVPGNRWDIDKYQSQEPPMVSSRFGGFIDDMDLFDAGFFEISPREAQALDPQQRHLLEVVYHTLEDANQDISTLRDSNIGVFTAICGSDYMLSQAKYGGEQNIGSYYGSGSSHATACGRISYFYGWQGPCYSVDTACSSSLVALHNACASLRQGECSSAIVAASNLNLTPEINISFTAANMLSADGRCKTFDQAANGYVRGEGVGAVMLKRLSDAQRDGDLVQAVILGSAINQDGASGGLTIPNGVAQQRVLRAALKSANLEPSDVSYIEAHGTATPLGDPIEINALNAVYRAGQTSNSPLKVGSVKTNIGHLEAAAGMAGFIKVVLAMKHKTLPKHLHFETPSEFINWKDMQIDIVDKTQAWDDTPGALVAGVSAFGFGGSNAHILVGESPLKATSSSVESSDDIFPKTTLLKLTAKSAAAIPELAQRYYDYLSSDLTQLRKRCAVANIVRDDLPFRHVVSVDSDKQILPALASLAAIDSSTISLSDSERNVAYLFTGQGSQYAGMGQALYQREKVFRQAIDACASVLDEQLGFPLVELLWGDESSQLNDTQYTQPGVFCIEYALFRLCESWGVLPSVMLGHSVGEYAAACCAEVFSLADALRLLLARANLMTSLCETGAMCVVFSSEVALVDLLNEFEGELSIASYNDVENITLSGSHQAIDACVDKFESDGVRVHRLSVSHAFHSPLMTPMLAEFSKVAQQISYHQPKFSFVSTVTATLVDEALCDPQYWVRHVSQPVRFSQAMEVLKVHENVEIFIEIGPKPSLLVMGRKLLFKHDSQSHWVALMTQVEGDVPEVYRALVELYQLGVNVDWRGIYAEYLQTQPSINNESLPNYPFQHKRYWHEVMDANAALVSDTEAAWLNVLRQQSLDVLDQPLARLGSNVSVSQQTKTELTSLINVLREEHHDASNSLDHCHVINWIPLNEQVLDKSQIPSHLVVVSNQLVSIEPLVLALQAQGVTVVIALLQVGCDEFTNIGEHQVVLNPDNEEHWLAFEQVLQPLREVSNGAIQGLYFIDANKNVSPIPIATACAALTRATVLFSSCDIRVSLLTAGGVHNTGIVSPELMAGVQGLAEQSALIALGQSLAAEMHAVWHVCLDITVDDQCLALFDDVTVEQVINVLCCEMVYDVLSCRQGLLYAPQIDNANLSNGASPYQFKPQSKYLITGANGGIARSLTHHLLSNTQSHLVLLSRKPLADDYLAQLRAQHRDVDTRVSLLVDDLSSETELQETLAVYCQGNGFLTGVFHTAGLSGGLSQPKDLTAEDFANVSQAKVGGMLNLWAALKAAESLERLDFFMNFSSISSVWGAVQQAPYCAANAYLDRWSWLLRNAGFPVVCINWGPWKKLGLAAELDADDKISLLGIRGFSSEHAIELLESVLAAERSNVVCVEAEWLRLSNIISANRSTSLFIAKSEQSNNVALPSADVCAWIDDFYATPQEQRADLIYDYLDRQVRRVCKLDSDADIDGQSGFATLGIDSLLSVELKEYLDRDLRLPLSSTLLFEYPTLNNLSAYLLGQLNEQAGDAPEITTQPELAILQNDAECNSRAELEAVSTDSLEAMLLKRLKKIQISTAE